MTGRPVDDTAVLNALFADSPQGLFVFDADQRVTRYNPAGRGVRGVAAEDIIGHVVDDFTPNIDTGELRSLIDEVLSTGKPLRSRLVRGPSPSTRGSSSPSRCPCSRWPPRTARRPGRWAWSRT